MQTTYIIHFHGTFRTVRTSKMSSVGGTPPPSDTSATSSSSTSGFHGEMTTIEKKTLFYLRFRKNVRPSQRFQSNEAKRPLTPHMEAQPIRNKQNSNGPIRERHSTTAAQSLLAPPHFTPTHYVTVLRKHEMTHLHAMIRTHWMKVHSNRPLPPARSKKFHMTHLHAIIRTHQWQNFPTLTLLPPIRKIRNLYS